MLLYFAIEYHYDPCEQSSARLYVSQHLNNRLNNIIKANAVDALQRCGIGLEKECLRVNTEGKISQTPQPISLGSALTHPYITTDYSEALLELITPPCHSVQNALKFLCDLQKFVYDNLEGELLWSSSMPCVVAGETSIPLANYGSSNSGQMKHIYRRGLGYRYGRVMQVIAGVHFNFSFSDEFWSAYQMLEGNRESPQAFISESYFGVLRNLKRFGWVVPYLFGASPAVCKSFLNGQDTPLQVFNDNTYYHPFATSLRMGDIGYQNNKENEKGVVANYNSLNEYVNSLRYATETPCPEYEKIGVKVDGSYRQLNANILQIENEYYSTVRPKQILMGEEKPSLALSRRGVRYVELRSLDVNPFTPMGIDEPQMYFLKAFMVYCLLLESPPILRNEEIAIDINELNVAHHGRDPELKISIQGKTLNMREQGLLLCDSMRTCCEVLDQGIDGSPHLKALLAQEEKFKNPQTTPSAIMLDEMKKNNEGFFHLSKRLSEQHLEYFSNRMLDENFREEFVKLSQDSLKQQQNIEQHDQLSFDDYLQHYFAQY